MKPEGGKFVWVIGAPKTKDMLDAIEDRKKSGKHIVRLLTPEQKMNASLGENEQGVTWENDEKLKRWMFDNTQYWLGAEFLADPDEPMMGKFIQIVGMLMDLHNFDQSSAKVLNEDDMPMRNAMKNSQWIENGVAMKRIKDVGGKAKKYAVLVAAGPSLDSQWEELRRIRKDPRAAFFIVGRTYRQAMKQGVWPDFVIECEMYDWNRALWYFAPEPPPTTILACTISVCPDIMTAWPADKLVLMDHNTALLYKLKPGVDSVDGGNSVAHLAFNLAHFVGCNPICFAGVDLGYPDGKDAKDTHATGTFHEWGGDMKRAEHTFQEVMVVEANDGKELRSSPAYKRFGTFFELQIEKFKKDKPALKVYSFSPRGQKLAGVEYTEIGKWNPPGPGSLSGSFSVSPQAPLGSSGSSAASSTDASSTGMPASGTPETPTTPSPVPANAPTPTT